MANEVGALNEHWQKAYPGQPGPLYKTFRVGGEDHTPQFKSTVVLSDKIATGDVAASSKEAKRLAAEEWLAKWGKFAQPKHHAPPKMLPMPKSLLATAPPSRRIPVNIPAPIIHPETVVYLDLENKPKELEPLLRAGSPRIRVHVAAKWPALVKFKREFADSRVTFCEVDSGEANAADVALIVDVVRALCADPDHRAVIISGDGIFYALRDVLQGGKPAHPNFRHYIYAKTFLENLSGA